MFETIENIKPEKNDSKILGAIAYAGSIFLSFLAPLLIYLLAKEDKFARFHALQSLIIGVVTAVLFIVLWVLAMVITVVTFGIGALLFIFFIPAGLIFLLLYLYWAYLAYQGKAFTVPYVTEFVLKNI
jgi:uncharacterized membrane protein